MNLNESMKKTFSKMLQQNCDQIHGTPKRETNKSLDTSIKEMESRLNL